MSCFSNPKVKACLSSVYTYVFLFMLFYLIAFVIEVKHTHSKCEISTEFDNGESSRDCKSDFENLFDPCEKPALEFKYETSGTVSGQAYSGELKYMCAWSAETLVMNYLSIPVLIFFFVLFFRVFQRFKFLHIILANLLAILFLAISIILMIKDIDQGFKQKKVLKEKLNPDTSYNHAIYIVNVIFSILAFIVFLRLFVFTIQRNRELNRNKASDQEAQKPKDSEGDKLTDKNEEKKEKKNKNKKKNKKKDLEPENEEEGPAIRL